MPVQPPDTRTSGSLPRARPRFDKSALRTACETTCEGYITLNPEVTLRLTCGALTVAYAAWHPQRVVAPCAAARRWRTLARCGRACAASVVPLKRAARYSSTVRARQRSCPQIAKPLQSALKPCVEVVVGLVAARDVEVEAANLEGVPSKARRARPRRCEVHMSAVGVACCKCKSLKCAVAVVLVQCHGNVCGSVHRGRVGTCVRARVCACAAQGLPNAPTRAGNGPPVVELPDHRTFASRARAPAMAGCYSLKPTNHIVIRVQTIYTVLY